MGNLELTKNQQLRYWKVSTPNKGS